MKVTLNASIPESRRKAIEDVVRRRIPGAEISWLPSRFPRAVMLIQPTATAFGDPSENPSIFATKTDDAPSIGDLISEMEAQISALLKTAVS